jgi:hypothetical protein
MPRSVAINIGANTDEPGFRAPVYPDGSFEYVPIPESQPTRPETTVPTYGDLAPHLSLATYPGLDGGLHADLAGTPVHLDPEFAEYPNCERYTYGDEHGVKARPIADLDEGDLLFFYATLTSVAGDADGDGQVGEDERPDWMPARWGAYIVGGFELARDPVTGDAYRDFGEGAREPFANNAHVKRETFDARVLVLGDPDGSALFDTAVPLSSRSGGTDANGIVTELSEDSGAGPWWRRPLRFDEEATAALLERVEGSIDS